MEYKEIKISKAWQIKRKDTAGNCARTNFILADTEKEKIVIVERVTLHNNLNTFNSDSKIIRVYKNKILSYETMLFRLDTLLAGASLISEHCKH